MPAAAASALTVIDTGVNVAGTWVRAQSCWRQLIRIWEAKREQHKTSPRPATRPLEGHSNEFDADPTSCTPHDAARALDALGFDDQFEIVWQRDPIMHFQACSCVGDIAHNALNARCNLERNRAALERALPEAVTALVHVTVLAERPFNSVKCSAIRTELLCHDQNGPYYPFNSLVPPDGPIW